jgi:hypothetical protein
MMNTRECATEAYKNLCKQGNYETAQQVLWLLRRGMVSLGLNDASYFAEQELNKCRLIGKCSRKFNL